MSPMETRTIKTETLFSNTAATLQVSEEDLLREGLRALLEQRLRDVKAQIFKLTGHYAVSSVTEIEQRYRAGTLEEADSWQDLQRLDHLEYKRDRLQELIRTLP